MWSGIDLTLLVLTRLIWRDLAFVSSSLALSGFELALSCLVWFELELCCIVWFELALSCIVCCVCVCVWGPGLALSVVLVLSGVV